MEIGFIGLGRMGNNMVLHLLEKKISVIAWNRSPEKLTEVGEAGATTTHDLDEFVKKLPAPRIIWLMVSAGPPVDEVINNLLPKLTPGDILIDGGNSNFNDTIRRGKDLAAKGIQFMDIGTSGGVESARHGACLMVGGDGDDFERVKPILKALAAPDAFGHFGPTGAGHFAKMVHNGIEYGMMEAIAEGASLLKHSPFPLDITEIFRVYSIQSIIESRLVGWTLAELKNDPELSSISSSIGSAGTDKRLPAEGDWTLAYAKQKKIHIPVIEASMKVRDTSSKDKENSPEGYRNKVVSAMRGQFGGHPVRKK